MNHPARIILSAIACCCAAGCAVAAPVRVCLVNDASVSRDTLRYVEAGLRAHESELAASIDFTCGPESKDTVVIRLRTRPARNQNPAVLGIAFVDDGKVLRQVEVFCNPVRRMVALWTPWPALEGWALATVAAHEMYHYLFNEHDHGNGPLNEKFMSAEALVQGFRNVSRKQ